MKIFITGVSGFLGRSLAAHWGARGHEVAGSTRRELRLGGPFDPAVFEGQDALVHCAHDFTRGSYDRNVTGTRVWMEAAASLGVRHQIFFSSYSAQPSVGSEYARAKRETERLFLEAGLTIVRPGLVIGNGGLYERQRAALLRTPVAPMLGGGAQPVARISLGDLLAAVTVVLETNRRGAFNLFDEPMPTYREFVRDVRAGRRTVFLPVPRWVALPLANIAAALRLPLPIQPGQIRALQANAASTWRSDVGDLLTGPRA